MQKEVFVFDELRNKVKTSKLYNKTVKATLEQYKAASLILKDHLIQEYQDNKQTLAKKGLNTNKRALTPAVQTKLEHKINVLKKRENSLQWGVQLQD